MAKAFIWISHTHTHTHKKPQNLNKALRPDWGRGHLGYFTPAVLESDLARRGLKVKGHGDTDLGRGAIGKMNGSDHSSHRTYQG